MQYKDPVLVSPANYRLLLEDGNYRIVEMVLPPHSTDIEHSHPHEMVYFMTGSKVRVHVPGGEPLELDIPDGHVMKHEPWTHRVENIGTREVKAIIFERKE